MIEKIVSEHIQGELRLEYIADTQLKKESVLKKKDVESYIAMYSMLW